MKKNDLIIHRNLTQDDHNFIFATFLKGLRYANPYFELIEETAYFENYRRVIKHLLDHCSTKIACLKDSPDVIIGYSIYSGSRLHWVHVKENWRQIGIAKDLMPQNFDSVSHLTNLGFEILKKHPEIIFNPFL